MTSALQKQMRENVLKFWWDERIKEKIQQKIIKENDAQMESYITEFKKSHHFLGCTLLFFFFFEK